MTTITLPREELERALEALESCGYTPENEMVFNSQKVQDARYALRARLRCPACQGNDADAPCAYPSEGKPGCWRDKRLAQPEQRPEPIGWTSEASLRDRNDPTIHGVFHQKPPNPEFHVALYRSPPPRQKLSEEEIDGHPMQPVALDDKGTPRFRANLIVRYLLDHGPFDMNHLAVQGFSDEDQMQFAQLIGYSTSGYGELSYVSDASSEAADRAAERAIERKVRG